MNNLPNHQHGNILIIAVFALLMLCGFAALAVDIGFLNLKKNELQNAVDAAALAGAIKLQLDLNAGGANVYTNYPNLNGATFVSDAQSAVCNNLKLNGFPNLTSSNCAGTSPTVSVTTWDKLSPKGPYATPAVYVQMTNTVPLFFASIFGTTTSSISAKGTSVVSIPSSLTGNSMPFMMADCALKDAWNSTTNSPIVGTNIIIQERGGASTSSCTSGADALLSPLNQSGNNANTLKGMVQSSITAVNIGDTAPSFTGTAQSVINTIAGCYNASSNPCNPVAVAVVASDNASTGNQEGGYWGETKVGTGLTSGNSYKVIGFACFTVTGTSTPGHNFSGNLTTGCTQQSAGGNQYYGVFGAPLLGY